MRRIRPIGPISAGRQPPGRQPGVCPRPDVVSTRGLSPALFFLEILPGLTSKSVLASTPPDVHARFGLAETVPVTSMTKRTEQ